MISGLVMVCPRMGSAPKCRFYSGERRTRMGFCINYHVFRYIHFALLFSLKKCQTCILYILVILFYKNAPKAALPTQRKLFLGGAKAQDGAFPTC